MDSKAFETGYWLGQVMKSVKDIDFSVSERNAISLVNMPYIVFDEYVPDGNREYQRGEVIRIDKEKYLLQNWGKIDPSDPPRIEDNQVRPSLVKLFRDGGLYDWVREEFCLEGFPRRYDGIVYRLKSNVCDSATPPPNDPQNWEEVVEEP